MLGRRGKLPVLAEIAGSGGADCDGWGLRRADFEALAPPLRSLDATRSLLVTGAATEARTLAVALAATAVAAGRRAILIECDLARPRLAAELGLSPAPGLHEYLRWEASAAELLQPLVLAGSAAEGADEPLVSVVAGRPADDAAALFALGSFRQMVARLREAYALSVLVGPPLGEDGHVLATLAAEVDSLLLALPPNGRARAAGTAARRLGPRPLGTVVVG